MMMESVGVSSPPNVLVPQENGGHWKSGGDCGLEFDIVAFRGRFLVRNDCERVIVISGCLEGRPRDTGIVSFRHLLKSGCLISFSLVVESMVFESMALIGN